MKNLKIGIIGCGAIGSKLARVIDKDLSDKVIVSGICDSDKQKAIALQKEIKSKPDILDIDALIKKSDFVIEAASAKSSADILKKAVFAKKDIMLMSIGGLLGNEELLNKANEEHIRVYLPSGAICGIDGVKAASQAKIKSARLITRKPPKGLKGAPYIVEKNIDLDGIKEETIIFNGTASEAVKAFPANINVSAILSLAGIGAKETRVTIIAVPGAEVNSHEIEVAGDFGKLTTKTENVSCPDNPKTSYLAVLSAIATLKQILSSVKIGA
ncbi:MAG: aspartate dehydrogenase [Candidatus Omnitrophica bacterium]|nr:aspartate dehydrogenase [Candidatus Omnitrophota bacterium]